MEPGAKPGLADSFQRWAWQQLEAQDRPEPEGPIDWKPIWRIETLNGVNTLRYMRADPAASTTCVECHNRLEQRPETVAMRLAGGISTGKMWKLHQLMGALEINIPLDRVEARAEEHNRLTFMVVLGCCCRACCASDSWSLPTWRARAPSRGSSPGGRATILSPGS